MLLDTSGLLCLIHRDELEHEKARDLFAGTRVHLVHGYVLAEFIALTNARKLPRQESLTFSRALIDSARVEVVWVSELLHRDAHALLEQRLDKSYSLCDAVSFVVMRERGLTEALTTDHHFEQEGFVRLLP